MIYTRFKHCLKLYIVSFHELLILLCVSSVLDLVWLMVFIDTLNNVSVISCRSVLLVAETGVPGENHRLVASH
jgi:hypothetical protein